MENSEMLAILKHVDHTNLQPVASTAEIRQLWSDAAKYGAASICLPPCYVRYAYTHVHTLFPELHVGTVIGFPLGYSTIETKISETLDAIEAGADEIDMVINLAAVKNQDFETIKKEILSVRNACQNAILKVIIETCYLTESDMFKLCKIITEAKADYVKTSTGFGPTGATVENVKLLREYIGPDVKIKAAGGIDNFRQAAALLEAGADRLGSSKLVRLYKTMLENPTA